MAPDGHIPTVPSDTSDPIADATYKLGDFSIDEGRPMKVAVIGAGFSGINAAIRFSQKVPNVDLAVYEKNAGIGGTWFANKYPGLACDIPSHCYQYTFTEKTDWSTFYSPGKEIYDYLNGVVDKYKVGHFIKLNHELIHARYDEKKAKWDLTIRRPKTAASVDTNEMTQTTNGVNGDHDGASGEPEVIQDPNDAAFEIIHTTVDFVFACVGPLSRWSWPTIPGLHSFSGSLIHSASWEGQPGDWLKTVESWGDKRVGVIGVGSSALQIVPALQSKVKGLWNFVRGKTWLAAPFAGDKIGELLGMEGQIRGNYEFSEEDKAKFSDLTYYKQFRRALESELNSVHTATLRGSKMQLGAVEAFRADMLKRLEKKPWIADHLIPDFPVACRRLTPGPGYLEALCEDNVEFVTTHIKSVNEKGIELEDGTLIELDIIICATGYDTSFQFPFPILGRNGLSLQNRYSPHPQTYLTLCTDGFPNLFFSLGPNAAVGSGSLLVIMERQVDYAVSVVKKMQRERIRSVEVSEEAVRDFEEYLEAYFPTTVYSAKCRSWYKAGKEEGRVVGLWPGSCLHAVRAFANPRWEDFKYEYVDEYDEEGVRKKKANRFFWFGDGSTWNEMHEGTNRAWYLDDDQVDYPLVPQ